MNEVKNYYKFIPKNLKPKYYNPNYEKHKIILPARILCIGGSGSGKTNTLIHFIHITSGTFEYIALCVKSKEEPLYLYLEDKLKDRLDIFENGDIPDIESFQDKGQSLIIFDDLILQKDQKKIEEYFIRGRKVGGGITMFYLSQSYYKIPKIIRINSNYLIIKKLSSKKDLSLILNEYNINTPIEKILKMYEIATSKKEDSLLIDIDADENDKFRRNFLDVFNVDNIQLKRIKK